MYRASKRQISRFVLFCLALVVISWLLSVVFSPLLVPFGISLFLSYLLAPFVAFCNRRWMPRTLVVLTLLILTLALGTLISIIFIPHIYSEVLELVRTMPRVVDTVVQTWLPSINQSVLQMGIINQEQINVVVKEVLEFVQLSDKLHQALLTILRTAPQVVGTLLNLVLIPLFTFFLLKDYELLKEQFYGFIPRDILQPFKVLMQRIGQILRQVIKGQLMVAGIVGLLYIIGFWVIDLRSATVIGAVAGICRIIPYVDLLVGGSLALVALFSNFHGGGQLFGLLLVFLIVQSVDGMVITPRIVGKKSGLHPFMVIISVISFGSLLGFWGVILAIPLIAIAKVIIGSAIPFYKASPAYDPQQTFPLDS